MAGEYTFGEITAASVFCAVLGSVVGSIAGAAAARQKNRRDVDFAYQLGVGNGRSARAREFNTSQASRYGDAFMDGWQEHYRARDAVEAQDREWSRTQPMGSASGWER